MRPSFSYKTKPYRHQTEAERRAAGRAFFAFFMEMGTGKTKVIIDEMSRLWCEGLIDCAVIYAPKGVYLNWIAELQVHMGIPYHALPWVSGGGNREQQRELAQLVEPDDTRLRILIVNVEALSTKGVALKFVERFCQSGRSYQSLDESTVAKNPTATRTKNLVKLATVAVYRRIATGSPTPNSPLDLFSQFEFLQSGSLGHRSYFNFKKRYAVQQQKIFGGRRVNVVVGYRNIPELKEAVEPHSYRVLKEDCMDLPPKVYRMLNVDLTDEQSRMYRAMRDNAFVEFEGGFTSSTQAIVTLTRLQQIVCGHIADEDGDVHSIKSNRVSAMMEDLEGVSGGTIVWSRWRHEIAATVEALRSAYGEESVAEYHGGNTNTREDDARRFINSDRCRFMVSTQQSGGYGNTWLKGTYTYYMSNSFNLEHRVQSEDRPHRGGQTEKCTYTDLRAIGTVDERLIAALRAKINVAASIQGEDPRAWLV